MGKKQGNPRTGGLQKNEGAFLVTLRKPRRSTRSFKRPKKPSKTSTGKRMKQVWCRGRSREDQAGPRGMKRKAGPEKDLRSQRGGSKWGGGGWKEKNQATHHNVCERRTDHRTEG